MKIKYLITPAMRSMQGELPWRVRTLVSDKQRSPQHFASLSDIHNWIKNKDHSKASRVVIELWEHSTFEHQGAYAKGKLVMAIENDADWVTAVLCYEGKYRELFARIG